MRTTLLPVLLFASAAGAGEPAPTFPPDVTAFVERRELCDHFRGEEPYDAERQAFLAKSIVELCTGTDQQLAALKSRHSANSVVMARLSQFETDIEPREKE